MLEFIFAPLTAYAPALSVLIFSVIILFIINIFYRILINQNDARHIKQRTKELSKEMKEEQKAGNTDKSKALMSEMLGQNSKMMKMTMKPMIISLIIVVILLPSLATFYGDKIAPMTDGQGSIMLNGNTHQIEGSGSLIRVDGGDCTLPCTLELDGSTYKVMAEGSGVKFAQIVAVMPLSIPFFGDSFGWLGWYIICSIPLVVLMRKFMKIQM